jgi:hypothetical protein
MKYDFTSIYSELFFAFEIEDEFIINYKAYKTFLEYRKTLELGKKEFNNQTKKFKRRKFGRKS